MSLKPLLVAALVGLAALPPAMADDSRQPRPGNSNVDGWASGYRGGERGGQGGGSLGSDQRGQGGGGGGGGGGNKGWGGNRGQGGDARVNGGGNGGNAPIAPSGRTQWDGHGGGWNRGDRGGAPARPNDGARLNDGGNGGGQQGRAWGGDRGGSNRPNGGGRGDWMRGDDSPGRTRSPSWQSAPAVRPVEPATRGWVNQPPLRRPPQAGWPSDARWWDNHHHHNYYYPRPGYYASGLSTHAYGTFYLGNRYWYDNGIWYSPYNSGYVVVRPPYGVVVSTLPSYYTMVYGHGITYYYANGVYYAPWDSGGYQVVAPPPDVTASSDAAPSAYEPPIIYPSQGQSAEQQAQDQYECHAWSVRQSGFDPTTAPAGQPGSDDAVLRGNYTRAFTACMEGRGYAVN